MQRMFGFAALACLPLAVGCATAPTAMSPAAAAAVRGQSVRVVRYPPPHFELVTAGKVMAGGSFGLVGALIAQHSMQTEGDKLIAEVGAADPAAGVGEQLASLLTGSLGASGIANVETPPADDQLSTLRRQLGSGIVLDVRTLGWQIGYYRSAPRHYHLDYVARARLVRLDDASVLSQASCRHQSDDPPEQRPTLDGLKANNGEVLKAHLRKAADDCARQLAAGMRLQ